MLEKKFSLSSKSEDYMILPGLLSADGSLSSTHTVSIYYLVQLILASVSLTFVQRRPRIARTLLGNGLELK